MKNTSIGIEKYCMINNIVCEQVFVKYIEDHIIFINMNTYMFENYYEQQWYIQHSYEQRR